MEDFVGHSWKFDKITQLLAGACAFIMKNIKGRVDLIFEAFEVLENVQRIGNSLHSFIEYLVANVRNNEELYVNANSTFVARISSMTDEMRKKKAMPSNYKIKQIKAS